MTSTPVKNIGAVANGTGIAVPNVKSAGKVSFETVWNKQTDKNSPEQMPSENSRTASQKDDAVVRDSLKSKDSHKNVVKQPESTDSVKEIGTDELREMDPREWEEAMEVLGAAATELMQQIAESFGMSVEEVQDMMADLNMDQLELLQPDKLAQLLLAAGGAEDMTALLTDGELYQQYQTLMEQAQVLLNECSEELQTDVKQLLGDFLAQDEVLTVQEEVLPIEVTVENDDSEEVPDRGQKSESTVKDTNALAEEPVTKDAPLGKSENAENDKQTGQQGNLLLQHLHTEQFDPQAAKVEQPNSVWSTDTQDIMRQIMDFMRIQVKPDMSDLEMQLHPAHLGTLQIHVASKGGTITAEFVAQNESVKAALESQMVQLKESFAEQGMKVDAIEVMVQTHQFEQNLEQGQDRQQNSPDRRNRTRRIQLDGSLDMAAMDEMDEDEQLTARMMEANGNTVDYTA